MASELNECKSRFYNEMEKSFYLLKEVNTITPPLNSDIINSMYELSFLQMYRAWEFFLEKTFVLYMLGKETDKGYRPICYVNPPNEEHAYELIKGGARYPSWLNIEFIREKAELFFKDGSPFKEILYDKVNIKDALTQMTKLRNAIVHISKKALDDYESVVRKEIGSSLNLSVGEFLSRMKKEGGREVSYISYYRKILEVSSDEIIK
ncbi:MAG: hypothetical protein QXH60_02885 [Candidatus Pacearchaeota archaeon]